jgi:hypothetical protein
MASFELECEPVRALLCTTRIAVLPAFEVDPTTSTTGRVPRQGPELGIILEARRIHVTTRNVDRAEANEHLGGDHHRATAAATAAGWSARLTRRVFC